MRLTALVILLAGLAFARPGPNTANLLKLAEPVFTLSLKTLPSCPASFELTLGRDMPNPGWSLRAVQVERKDNRVVVHLTGTRAEGMFPQVITPVATKINLGRFKKGPHVLEIHYRTSDDPKLKLVQVAMLEGS